MVRWWYLHNLHNVNYFYYDLSYREIHLFIAHFTSFQPFLFPLYEATFITDQGLFVINDDNPVRPF